mgnify:CR=1 FL=1
MLCVAEKGDKIYDFLTNVLTPFFYLTSNFQYHRRGASDETGANADKRIIEIHSLSLTLECAQKFLFSSLSIHSLARS